MRYVRFALASQQAVDFDGRGVFQAAFALRRAGELTESELVWLAELDDWFARNLRAPDRLSLRSGYRQPALALCWFKDTAKEHLHRIRSLVALLKEHGLDVETSVSERPGYVVYDDEHQIAAVPFGTARRKDHRRRNA